MQVATERKQAGDVFSIAPMMEVTDRYFRTMVRFLTKKCVWSFVLCCIICAHVATGSGVFKYTFAFAVFFTVCIYIYMQSNIMYTQKINVYITYIYKDNSGPLAMIGRERANRALIGCESQ